MALVEQLGSGDEGRHHILQFGLPRSGQQGKYGCGGREFEAALTSALSVVTGMVSAMGWPT